MDSLNIGKAHQRIIRESKGNSFDFGLLGEPNTDIRNPNAEEVSRKIRTTSSCEGKVQFLNSALSSSNE